MKTYESDRRRLEEQAATSGQQHAKAEERCQRLEHELAEVKDTAAAAHRKVLRPISAHGTWTSYVLNSMHM